MWQSAPVAAAALAQVHLLFGGLGGVIAVIVGGVISAIAMRNARHRVAAPATNPQPAPPSRRREPPVSYGEPAPPTSPSRRLHPGPISLRPAQEPPAEASPSSSEDGRKSTADAPATILFNPDLFGATAVTPSAESNLASLPLLRSSLTLSADLSALAAAPQPASGLVHAPLWIRTPFAPTTLETLSAFSPPTNATTAPLWSLRAEVFICGEAESALASASQSEPPLWGSQLRATSLSASSAEGIEGGRERTGAPESVVETPAPLWPSSLRPSADAEEE